jgi:hypothetical protein
MSDFKRGFSATSVSMVARQNGSMKEWDIMEERQSSMMETELPWLSVKAPPHWSWQKAQFPAPLNSGPVASDKPWVCAAFGQSETVTNTPEANENKRLVVPSSHPTFMPEC